MNTKHASDLDGDEIIKRRDEALRRASNTPPKSHGKPTNAKKKMRQRGVLVVIVHTQSADGGQSIPR